MNEDTAKKMGNKRNGDMQLNLKNSLEALI
jgi:hypothetical protein